MAIPEGVGIQRTRAAVKIVDGVRQDLQWQSRQINGLPAKCVTRGTAWGNPYKIGELYNNPFKGETFAVTQENCLELFEIYARMMLAAYPDWLEPLRGFNLACWCKDTESCHRSVLLRLLAETADTREQP